MLERKVWSLTLFKLFVDSCCIIKSRKILSVSYKCTDSTLSQRAVSLLVMRCWEERWSTTTPTWYAKQLSRNYQSAPSHSQLTHCSTVVHLVQQMTSVNISSDSPLHVRSPIWKQSANFSTLVSNCSKHWRAEDFGIYSSNFVIFYAVQSTPKNIYPNLPLPKSGHRKICCIAIIQPCTSRIRWRFVNRLVDATDWTEGSRKMRRVSKCQN